MRIAIFGTGSALKDFLSILPDAVTVVGLGDNNQDVQGLQKEGYDIYSAEAFAGLDCDLMVIAARGVDSIRSQLIGLGVAAEKIAAFYPSYSKQLAEIANADINKINTQLSMTIPNAQISTMYLWPETEQSTSVASTDDFVRSQTLKLFAERINSQGIQGSIAELGVYQGELSAMLNALFPDRDLRLFDTFEGFSEKDISSEKKANFSGAALGDFANTSVNLVMSKMPFADKVSIYKGFFPDSIGDLEDSFALVSLDVDLYEPTLAGLEWFYARLSKGGGIFVHDYNNRRYMGVRSAVETFLKSSDASAMPLADFAGSIVILK